jgi:hypothetical protein
MGLKTFEFQPEKRISENISDIPPNLEYNRTSSDMIELSKMPAVDVKRFKIKNLRKLEYLVPM